MSVVGRPGLPPSQSPVSVEPRVPRVQRSALPLDDFFLLLQHTSLPCPTEASLAITGSSANVFTYGIVQCGASQPPDTVTPQEMSSERPLQVGGPGTFMYEEESEAGLQRWSPGSFKLTPVKRPHGQEPRSAQGQAARLSFSELGSHSSFSLPFPPRPHCLSHFPPHIPSLQVGSLCSLRTTRGCQHQGQTF